jgi:hypothetical protein
MSGFPLDLCLLAFTYVRWTCQPGLDTRYRCEGYTETAHHIHLHFWSRICVHFKKVYVGNRKKFKQRLLLKFIIVICHQGLGYFIFFGVTFVWVVSSSLPPQTFGRELGFGIAWWDVSSLLPCPDRLWSPPSLLTNLYRELWTPGIELTTYLHVVPRLRICRAMPPLPNTSSWRGT